MGILPAPVPAGSGRFACVRVLFALLGWTCLYLLSKPGDARCQESWLSGFLHGTALPPRGFKTSSVEAGSVPACPPQPPSCPHGRGHPHSSLPCSWMRAELSCTPAKAGSRGTHEGLGAGSGAPALGRGRSCIPGAGAGWLNMGSGRFVGQGTVPGAQLGAVAARRVLPPPVGFRRLQLLGERLEKVSCRARAAANRCPGTGWGCCHQDKASAAGCQPCPPPSCRFSPQLLNLVLASPCETRLSLPELFFRGTAVGEGGSSQLGALRWGSWSLTRK